MADDFDPAKIYDQATTIFSGSASSATVDIFGLNEAERSTPVIISRGKRGGGFQARGRLEAADQDQAARPSPGVPGEVGLYGDLIKQPVKLFAEDPKKYLELQRSLWKAGFYGSVKAENMPWGQDVQGTLAAWKQVLDLSVQARESGLDLTPDDVLRRGAAAGGGGDAEVPGAVIQYDDPAQVAGAVQRAAQASLGRNLTDEEVQTFVSEFHAAQTSYGQEYAQAQSSNATWDRALTAPDLTAQAEQFVEQNNTGEIAGNNEADYVRAIAQLLGG